MLRELLVLTSGSSALLRRLRRSQIYTAEQNTTRGQNRQARVWEKQKWARAARADAPESQCEKCWILTTAKQLVRTENISKRLRDEA